MRRMSVLIAQFVEASNRSSLAHSWTPLTMTMTMTIAFSVWVCDIDCLRKRPPTSKVMSSTWRFAGFGMLCGGRWSSHKWTLKPVSFATQPGTLLENFKNWNTQLQEYLHLLILYSILLKYNVEQTRVQEGEWIWPAPVFLRQHWANPDHVDLSWHLMKMAIMLMMAMITTVTSSSLFSFVFRRGSNSAESWSTKEMLSLSPPSSCCLSSSVILIGWGWSNSQSTWWWSRWWWRWLLIVKVHLRIA